MSKQSCLKNRKFREIKMLNCEEASAESFSGKVSVAKVGDIDIAYRCVGSGEPVVLVHGIAEDGTSWSGIADRLANEGFRSIAIDWRGHGRTTVGQPQGTVEQLADDLLQFLELISGAAVCVGFSLGGVIVLEAALKRPDLVRKGIIAGASSKVGRAAAKFFAERIAQLETDPEMFGETLGEDTKAQIAHNKAAADDVTQSRLKAVGNGAGYVNAAKAMIALSAAPMTDRLREMVAPIHIVQGANDVFCPTKAADMLREAMPQAGYAEIPQAGHLMAVDQPEMFAEAILAELEKQSKSENAK
ncbi:alpha/beta hydrolase [Roseovarius pacificus]|uniref:alpha/beta fold hydrolase n=1 Tax=Roseovarius pacificus TaxID=337701 RepID=UPI002A189567|nr:alpha/beta hydrolase [Roseovarius pacificus]